MKHLYVATFILFTIGLSAQDPQGAKPGISINGAPCLIQNLVYSCVPRTCDSIEITAGDSIEFCTYQQIFLNTDTAYWMRWHFYGATNLPDTIWNLYPSNTPVCYWPEWDTAGIFVAEAFYNGALSAYPTSDCYQQGPSHWFIKVIVLPNPNTVDEHVNASEISVHPNPGNGLFTIESPAKIISATVTDLSGKEILSSAGNQVDLSGKDAGIYLLTVTTDNSVSTMRIVLQ